MIENNLKRNILLKQLEQKIADEKKNMAHMAGCEYYECLEGYSQEDLYNLCGRNDYVTTIEFRKGSESALKYGEEITVRLVYTQKEREKLEADSTALNDVMCVKAENLYYGYDEDKSNLLLSEGFHAVDVVSMFVCLFNMKENTFPSKSKRNIKKINVEFEPYGNGGDIGWIYGYLKRMIEEGIALTPEEMCEYYAYKIIIEPGAFTEDERKLVYTNEGKVYNKDVAFQILLFRREAKVITENETKLLNSLWLENVTNRIKKLDTELQGLGGLEKFKEKYPEQANLILSKVLKFKERRYNVVGKHLLYMDLDSFIHIYLRHVGELSNKHMYNDKTKFQLDEKDVLDVIRHVMIDVNDEYQVFKDANPNRKFRKYSDKAYYINGDYYRIDVDENGRLVTFFKEVDRK